jgi:hypothetical protein
VEIRRTFGINISQNKNSNGNGALRLIPKGAYWDQGK